ncbi:hypothetical protein VPMS16_1190 [Vibrio sp. 16]|nr:hypothetical protein VPMS16_1190 [Vibrio sp. 16]
MTLNLSNHSDVVCPTSSHTSKVSADWQLTAHQEYKMEDCQTRHLFSATN